MVFKFEDRYKIESQVFSVKYETLDSLRMKISLEYRVNDKPRFVDLETTATPQEKETSYWWVNHEILAR